MGMCKILVVLYVIGLRQRLGPRIPEVVVPWLRTSRANTNGAEHESRLAGVPKKSLGQTT